MANKEKEKKSSKGEELNKGELENLKSALEVAKSKNLPSASGIGAVPIAPSSQKQPQITPEMQKEFEKITDKLKILKSKLVKKFPYIISISLLPPQASSVIEEEEEVEKKSDDEKLMHVVILIPDDKEKQFPQIKIEAIKAVQDLKPRIWVTVKLLSQLWDDCLNRKFDLVNAVATSFPLYDKGTLGILRAASLHVSMLLQKFEHYIVSYVLVGSFITGKATPDSDADVYVLVDDTDVRPSRRLEVWEKLRRLIAEYGAQACYRAGVKNALHSQSYILTNFWDDVRNANPVIFTMIRDGVPLYDVRTFVPWKLLLRMGKIIGTPEAMDRFMNIGEEVEEDIRERFVRVLENLYFSVLTPSQGLLMYYGLEPPNPRETIRLMREVFVNKEKLVKKQDADFLERMFGLYKQMERGAIKGMDGKMIDDLIHKAEDYRKVLRDAAAALEKKIGEGVVLRVHDEAMSLIESIVGKASVGDMIKKLEDNLVKKGKLPKTVLTILEKIRQAKTAIGKGKISRAEINNVRRDADLLMRMLTEYAQRKDMLEAEKLRFRAKIDGKDAELYIFEKNIYVAFDNAVKKIDVDNVKITDSSRDDLDVALKKEPNEGKITPGVLAILEKLLGKKVEILV